MDKEEVKESTEEIQIKIKPKIIGLITVSLLFLSILFIGIFIYNYSVGFNTAALQCNELIDKIVEDCPVYQSSNMVISTFENSQKQEIEFLIGTAESLKDTGEMETK